MRTQQPASTRNALKLLLVAILTVAAVFIFQAVTSGQRNAQAARVLPPSERRISTPVPATSELGVFRARLKELRVGKAVSSHGVTMYPLMARSGKAEYLTLDEALASKVLEIAETNVVADAKLINKGTQPVLIVDGEQIVGAKQNRIFNSSLMAPPKSELVAKVSCVEQGRWAGTNAKFDSAGTQLFGRARQSNMAKVSESMAASSKPVSDQGAIWADVARANRAAGAPAMSTAMQDAYRTNEAELEGYVKDLKWQPGQVGAVFCVGGEILGLDIFDSAETFRKLLPKLVKSYALDDISNKTRVSSDKPADVKTFLAAAAAADGTIHKSQGMGSDLRLAGWKISGSVLVVDKTAVHSAVFARPDEDEKPDVVPMAPYRQRVNPHLEQMPRPR